MSVDVRDFNALSAVAAADAEISDLTSAKQSLVASVRSLSDQLKSERSRATLAEQELRELHERAEEEQRHTNSRNPRHFDIIEGGRVYQALHIDSKSVLDALRRVKKCLGRSV